MEYTNFGRVIKGMDVAMNIQTGDLIKSAKLRALTDNDKKLFNEALKAESDRRTQ
jgi:cyclophilin family peptidyl-prolyl cis-trans isomerase